MIRIGICDDDINYLNSLSRTLNNIATKNMLNFDINIFTTGAELLQFNSTHKDYFDIIFLDILLNLENGINIAKELRKYKCKSYIIFITTSKDYALESYEVDAYKYLLKPYKYEDIEKLLLLCKNKIETKLKNTICVKNNQDIFSFNLDNVVYFESNLRKIIAHLSDGQPITFYNKMSDFEEELQSSMFIRCHRSFLVNLLYLKSIVGTDIITTTNEYIPISKKYMNSTKEAFTEFIKRKLYEC